MSTLGVQYVHTMTPPQRDVVTDRSSGHGVSSTPPSPLTRATPASLAAPSGSGGPIQQPAAPTARTTLAVHKDIYADGWNNGDDTSNEDEEVLQRPQTPMRSELEEKRSITRMHNNRPTHAQRTEGHQTSESSESDFSREKMEYSRRRKSERTKIPRGRTQVEREEEMRRTKRTSGRDATRHQKKPPKRRKEHRGRRKKVT